MKHMPRPTAEQMVDEPTTDAPLLRTDGSFDVEHYLRRGRRLRSEKAHSLLGLGVCPDGD